MGLRYNIIKKVTCPYCGFAESTRIPMRFLQISHLVNHTCPEEDGGCGQTFAIRVSQKFDVDELMIQSFEEISTE